MIKKHRFVGEAISKKNSIDSGEIVCLGEFTSLDKRPLDPNLHQQYRGYRYNTEGLIARSSWVKKKKMVVEKNVFLWCASFYILF